MLREKKVKCVRGRGEDTTKNAGQECRGEAAHFSHKELGLWSVSLKWKGGKWTLVICSGGVSCLSCLGFEANPSSPYLT